MKHFKDTKEHKPANAVTAASLGSMCSLITRKTCESTTCALLKAAPESKKIKNTPGFHSLYPESSTSTSG